MARVVVAASLVFLLVACATSPLGRKQLHLFPEEQMSQMGGQAFQEIKRETPPVEAPQVSGYVRCVADAITAELDDRQEWDVAVFAQEEPNAFALPGAKIGVNTGILKVAKNQDQLATVLSHEVAHVIAEHANERVSTSFATQTALDIAEALAGGQSAQRQQLFGLLGVGAQLGIILPFSRTQEREADLVGLDLMARAGFDPRASVEFWRNMMAQGGASPPEFLSTHPAGENRMEELRARLPQAMELYHQARSAGKRPQCGPPPGI